MNKHDKFVVFMKQMTIVFLLLGFLTCMVSFFVSGISQSYLIFIGGSIMVSSIIILIFSLSIVAMETVTDAPKCYRRTEHNIHHFQTNRLY